MKRRGRGTGGRKRPRGGTLRRPSRHRLEKTRILIVCEGKETEPIYFRGLREEDAVRERFVIEVRKGKGGSCLDVVQQAVAEKEKAAVRREHFDEVWCVLDTERAERRDQVIKARKLAEEHVIRLALSNPSFEI